MISFIVIGKNEDWRLEKSLSAIKRVAASELIQPYEIIYVDSQSTDGSVELAKQYANKIYLSTGACNSAIGRNIGAKEAEGDILFFIDGDMELREGVLPTILTHEGCLKYPFMAGIEYDILFDNDWNQKEERPRRSFIKGSDKVEKSPSMGGLFVITKQAWEDIGGMDNRYTVGEDYEFGFRAYGKGYKVRRIGQLWVNHYTRYYAIRPTSLSVYRFQALLSRNYFLKGYAFKTHLYWNYSGYLFVFSLFFSFWGNNAWLMLPYLLLLGYRTFRVLNRTQAKLKWLDVLCKRFVKDLLLIYYFCTFSPKQPSVSYTRVK